MKPYFPQNRLRQIAITRQTISELTPKELMRLYSELGVIIHTEYLAVNDTMFVCCGHPDFDKIPPGERVPKFVAQIRRVMRNRRPYKLFKFVLAKNRESEG